MKYIPLKKIYYTDPQKWNETYLERFNGPFTKHLDIPIQEYNRRNEYPAFYCHTEEIFLLQSKIMYSYLNLLKIVDNIPNAGINQFLKSCLFEEIQSSNDIEGVRSTRKEITEAYLSQDKYSPNIRLWGIVNKYIKIIGRDEIPLKTSIDIRNLYNDFILKEIIRDDPQNVPDGKIFRKTSVDVVTGTQKTIHRGVNPESNIIEYMDKSLILLNDENIPPFIRIAIFHYLFGYIHPFYDGNGRMSRFITSYLLAKNLHPTIALRLSLLIKKHKNDYYKLFELTNSEFNKGDLTPFIIWSMEFILLSIENTYEILNNKLTTFHKYKKYLKIVESKNNNLLNEVYDILLQAAIFSDEGASLKEIAAAVNRTPRTIHSKLDKLNESLLLVDRSTKQYHYKINIKNLEFMYSSTKE